LVVLVRRGPSGNQGCCRMRWGAARRLLVALAAALALATPAAAQETVVRRPRAGGLGGGNGGARFAQGQLGGVRTNNHPLRNTSPTFGDIGFPTTVLKDVDASGEAQKRDAEIVLRAFDSFFNSPRVCSNPENSLSFRNRGAGEGLGSLLNGYVITFARALTGGQRLCSHEATTNYVNSSSCPAQSWECLFEPISTECPCADNVPGSMKPRHADRCFDMSDRESYSSNGLRTYIYEAIKSFFDEPLPMRDDHWYMALLYHYVLRPNEKLRNFRDALRTSLFPDINFKDAIACHVRRGDHWMGQHHEDQSFVETIKAVANATSSTTVLLASDDFTALKTFPDKLKPLRVISIPGNYSILHELENVCNGRSRKCQAAKFLRSKGSSDEGLLLMSQILLMAETKVTIGSIGSNFARLIHQLQWARSILQGEGMPHPMLSFMEMSGAQYFACGWRRSTHLMRSSAVARKEWVARYKFYKSIE